MLKITGKLTAAHEVDYRGDIEDAIETYVMGAIKEVIKDWMLYACEDRPTIEFLSHLGGDEAGIELDLQDFVDSQVRVYEDGVKGGDSHREVAKVWYDFFAASAARMAMFIEPEDM